MKCANIISWLREYDLKSKGVGNANISDGELLKELIFKIMHWNSPQVNFRLQVENENKRTTPADSPLHKGRNERKKALQYNNAAYPPPV